jgi:hypothetical protein
MLAVLGMMRRTVLAVAACVSVAAVSSTAMACDCSGYDSYHRGYHDRPDRNYSCYGGGYRCGYEGGYVRSYYHRCENRYNGDYHRRAYDRYRDCDRDCY